MGQAHVTMDTVKWRHLWWGTDQQDKPWEMLHCDSWVYCQTDLFLVSSIMVQLNLAPLIDLWYTESSALTSESDLPFFFLHVWFLSKHHSCSFFEGEHPCGGHVDVQGLLELKQTRVSVYPKFHRFWHYWMEEGLSCLQQVKWCSMSSISGELSHFDRGF